jgi:hypothetical protein
MKFIIESNFQELFPAIRYNLYGERRHKRIFTAIGAKISLIRNLFIENDFCR